MNIDDRLFVAECLHREWQRATGKTVKQKKTQQSTIFGAILEAHCYGLSRQIDPSWTIRLLSPTEREIMQRQEYYMQISKMIAALQVPRSPQIPGEVSDPLIFLNNLDEFPLKGRPHEAFLQKDKEETDRLSAALSESKQNSGKDGFLKCRRCGSLDVDMDAKQTRSADEPMTVFARCNGCGTRWTMS